MTKLKEYTSWNGLWKPVFAIWWAFMKTTGFYLALIMTVIMWIAGVRK